MADKKTQIIEAAIKLFAQKGFHLTSIQEIADAAGIAKGSMYLYFKSKDDLLLSIFKYYYDLLFHAITTAGRDADLTPRERLSLSLKVQFEKVIEFRDFIIMQMKEQFIQNNEDLKAAAFNMKARSFLWLHNQLTAIYGESFKPYSLDCTNIFQSMINAYMGLIVFHQKEFDLNRLSKFLIDRMNDLAAGLMTNKPEPILSMEDMEDFIKRGQMQLNEDSKQLFDEIRKLRQTVEALQLEKSRTEDIISSLQVLEEELYNSNSKKIIAQGMISYLQQMNVPELKKNLKRLQTLVQAYFEKKQVL